MTVALKGRKTFLIVMKLAQLDITNKMIHVKLAYIRAGAVLGQPIISAYLVHRKMEGFI